MTPSSRVVFFSVRDASTKLERITSTAASHFEKKERILFVVENSAAAQYVDDLLWKTPSHSFLPHRIAEETVSDWVVVTTLKKNVNEARFAFNLCPTPLLIDGPFKIVYEFEDLSSPAKQQLSNLRFSAYKQAHYLIESR